MIDRSQAFGTTVAFKNLRPINPKDPKRCRGIMKVLVVDDNKHMTTIIQMMIEKKNHRVITANDGENGYSAYLQFKPDLVLTDIQMPRKNGFELMARIRSHNPSIMGIYMTGDPDRFLPRLKEEQNRHQVDFICKPFSLSELSMVLSKLQA